MVKEILTVGYGNLYTDYTGVSQVINIYKPTDKWLLRNLLKSLAKLKLREDWP
jgi:hypothetical protein